MKSVKSSDSDRSFWEKALHLVQVLDNGKNMKILKSKQMLQYPCVEWEFVYALEQILYSKQHHVVPEK
jgi:hypothetical protein